MENETHSAYAMPTSVGRSPVASAAASRTLAAIDERNPSKLSPGSSKPARQTVVGSYRSFCHAVRNFHVASHGEPGVGAIVSSTACALAKRLFSLRIASLTAGILAHVLAKNDDHKSIPRALTLH